MRLIGLMAGTNILKKLCASKENITFSLFPLGCKRARFHSGKFSSDKKISFVLNLLVVHGSSQDKEKLTVQGKFSCVETGSRIQLFRPFNL